MGTAFWHLGKYEDALAAARKAVSVAPDMKEAHFNVAISELFLGNVAKTVSILETLNAAYPDYLAAQFMLSTAYCCEGQVQKGLAGFGKLNQSSLGPGLVGAFSDSASRLLNARQEGNARSVLEAAVTSGNRNEDIDRLLSVCN